MADAPKVFLSFAPENRDAVEAVARRLRDEGRLDVWFAPWSAVPGADFQQQLEDALAASQACAVFVGGGAESIAGWQSEELRAAIEARVDAGGGYRVAPAFLPGGRQLTRRDLPRFLRNSVQPGLEIVFRSLDDDGAFRRLLAGLLGVPPASVESYLAGSPAAAPEPRPAARRDAPSYASLTLTVGLAAGDAYPLAARGPGGDARGTLDAAGLAEAARGLLARVDGGEPAAAEGRALGERLFGALLGGPLRDVYTRSQGALRPGERLRLVLDIPADTAVAGLPWELLHDPDQGPLALAGVSVVRYVPLQQAAADLQLGGRQRVLLSAAHTPPPVEVGRELAAAQAALAGRPFDVVVEPHLTVELLRRRLRDGPGIWHFVGHGAERELLLEDVQGDPQPVGAGELQALLSGSGVRLALLSACHSTGAAAPLAGVAHALVRAGTGAVVAMQFGAAAEGTRAFAAELLGALAEGLPLEACVGEGRKALLSTQPDGLAWAMPALFSRAQQ